MLAKFSANAYFEENEHHCKPSPFHTSSVLEAEHPDIDCVFALIFFYHWNLWFQWIHKYCQAPVYDHFKGLYLARGGVDPGSIYPYYQAQFNIVYIENGIWIY